MFVVSRTSVCYWICCIGAWFSRFVGQCYPVITPSYPNENCCLNHVKPSCWQVLLGDIPMISQLIPKKTLVAVASFLYPSLFLWVLPPCWNLIENLYSHPHKSLGVHPRIDGKVNPDSHPRIPIVITKSLLVQWWFTCPSIWKLHKKSL